MGRRYKTDAQDAQLLKRRAALARCTVQLNHTLTGLELPQEGVEELVEKCAQMNCKLAKVCEQDGWGSSRPYRKSLMSRHGGHPPKAYRHHRGRNSKTSGLELTTKQI
jgi:hypothetical protein